MRTLLAISPHLDDAIFSAGGLLGSAAQQGWRVVIATMFTGNVAGPSGFALACQLDKGLAADVDYMALRRAEDERACAAIGAEVRHLPLLEAPHRGYNSAQALFGEQHATDGIGEAVEEVVAALIEELRPQIVLGPLGIGNHVDHQVVRTALERIAPPDRQWWWEDWPYSDKSLSVPSLVTYVCRLTEHLRRAKLQACLAYETQLGFQFGGSDSLTAKIMAQHVERFHPAADATLSLLAPLVDLSPAPVAPQL